MNRVRRTGAGAAALLGLWVGAVVLARLAFDAQRPRETPVEAAAPAVADPTRIRFVAVGDIGHANATARNVAAAVGKACVDLGCDFGVLLGDNLYPRGMSVADDPRMHEVFSKTYAPLGIPYFAVLGNHDDDPLDPGPARRAVDFSSVEPLFQMPGRMYRFATGTTSFYALDTPRIFWFGGDEHAAWLDRRSGETGWRVAFGHHPFRSNGPHGNAGTYEGWPGVPYLSGRALQTFFERQICGQFDLYLAGHDHNQQLLERCGVTLIVTGAGSGAREVIDRGNEPLFASSQPGFVWIELGSELRVRFYDAEAGLLYERLRPR